MSERDIQKDKEICEKANKGPWLDVDGEGHIVSEEFDIADIWSKNDLLFITTAREALPYYINRAIELENQVDVLSTTVNQYVTPYYEKRAEADKLREENRILRERNEKAVQFLNDGKYCDEDEENCKYCEGQFGDCLIEILREEGDKDAMS